MDLTYLFEYVKLLTLGICLCVGYALKTAFVWFPNKYIPLAALSMGCIINILINLETGINAVVKPTLYLAGTGRLIANLGG